jgi:ribosomal-protein-alanine N-acetyltransferase
MNDRTGDASEWSSGPFRNQNLAHFHTLDRICFPPDIAYSPDDLEYLLESSRCFNWVIEDGAGALIGFIIVERGTRRGGPRGHVITIDVAPEARRQGVGRMLLEAAERQFRKEGATLLLLEVAEDNLAAQAFYKKFGFLEIGRIPKYYAGRLAARVMEKAL